LKGGGKTPKKLKKLAEKGGKRTKKSLKQYALRPDYKKNSRGNKRKNLPKGGRRAVATIVENNVQETPPKEKSRGNTLEGYLRKKSSTLTL